MAVCITVVWLVADFWELSPNSRKVLEHYLNFAILTRGVSISASVVRSEFGLTRPERGEGRVGAEG
jgi:hypothetical protein